MNGPRPIPRLVVLGLLSSLPGCGEGDRPLVVATSWSARECPAATAADAGPIQWVRLPPGTDPTRLVGRRTGIDVVLGGPSGSYRRLSGAGRLAPIAPGADPAWAEARRTPIGWAISERQPPGAGPVALGDPRRDPATLAWASARLSAGPWPEGYAELVRTVARARPIGRGAESAESAVERGLAGRAPALGIVEASRPGVRFEAEGGVSWAEGVAIVAGTPRLERARAFVRGVARAAAPAAEGGSGAWLADLLGATLVDPQDELRAARSILDRAGGPDRLARRLVEAPPWPPASVARLRASARRRGEDPDALVESLAELVAPEVLSRAWLLESWRRPERPIDGGFLAELAAAAGGRLADEPRFRAWVRAEWSAWAAQRYRRVLRESGRRPR